MFARRRAIRVFGLPLQFVVVVVVSLALAIFFGAWAADARVQARAEGLSLSGIHSLYVDSYAPGGLHGAAPVSPQNGAQPLSLQEVPEGESEQQLWERAFLFACPLH